MNMKVACGILLGSICLLLPVHITYAWVGVIHTNRALVKEYTDNGWNQYKIFSKPSITVIKPKKFSMHFFPKGELLKNFTQSYGCAAGLNGTYFGFSDDKTTFYPAWVRYQFGSYLKPPYKPAVDRNLRVLLSGNGTTIDLMDNDAFDFATLPLKSPWRYANTWPWLVRNGKINHDIVQQKSHRQRDTTRAWFIRNPNGEVQFIIATEPISLPQFIAFSYGVGIGTWAFQFVNLDGGSSTSLVTPYNSYQSKKRLPSFICIQ